MNNEIVTYTPNPAATLVEIRRDNERFPRLHSYPQEVAHKMMMAVVLKANELFGTKPEMQEVNQIAWDLYSELMNDVEGMRTYNLTFEEISRAIRKAATGGAEFYGKVSFYFLYKCIMQFAKTEVMAANTQMLRLAETNRQQLYKEKTEILLAPHVRNLLDHSKV